MGKDRNLEQLGSEYTHIPLGDLHSIFEAWDPKSDTFKRREPVRHFGDEDGMAVVELTHGEVYDRFCQMFKPSQHTGTSETEVQETRIRMVKHNESLIKLLQMEFGWDDSEEPLPDPNSID